MTKLDFEAVIPEGIRDGAPVVVLLHGRGADRHDLKPLGRFLPGTTALLTPQAPFPGEPWGYGPGWAWYRYVADDRVVPETLAQSLEYLDAFILSLPDLLPFAPGPLVLGGFSQGGTTSMAYALKHPGRVPQVVNLSGFLADAPVVEVSAERVAGTRFFWGHGEADPAIPHRLAVRGRARLAEAGAGLTAHDYGAGHTITPEEVQDLSRWLKAGWKEALERS